MSALAESRRQTGARFLMIWIVPIALLAAVSFATPVLNDGDTFWHVAAGRWMIQHGRVPATDPFSYTFLGHPWIAHEWLTETFMGGAYLAGGWAGVMLLTAAALALTALLVGAWLLRWMGLTPAFLMIALALACISPGILARPHLTILPMFAFWTIELLKAREAERAPPLWLALFMLVWANLHSSFVVGFALALAFGLEAFLSPRTWTRRTLIGWALFVDAALVATLVTPHGFDGVLFPLKVLNMKTLPLITEWQSPDFMKLTTLELALLAGVFFAFWRGVKLSAIRALILLGLIHMALQHERQEVLVGVVAPLILAEPVGRALGRAAPAEIGWRLPLPQTLLGGGLLVAALIARIAIPQPRVDGPTAPIAALAHVPAALRAQPVLNAYDFGGFLIFEGVKPYIDGRADMYGDNFVNADSLIQGGDAALLGRAIADYRIRWAILEPSLPVVGVLERTPGWTRLYADPYAVVLQNANPPPAPLRPSSPPPAPARLSSVHG
ncbi:MAG TPA: hypothetical protein VMT68_10715 [Caulobacteraceae bacterium]|nr:hypothetical protein [Caulobacteraceae bacterium]